MQIAILGPLEVRDDEGRPIDVAGARLRTLLCRLAIGGRRPVPPAALVDAVWGEQPPSDATNALQTLVSRLRRVLGAAAITQSAAGYRLADGTEIDAERFEQLAAAGGNALRNDDPVRAVALLDQALALWRGAALSDPALSGTALSGTALSGTGLSSTAGGDVAAHALRLDDLHLGALIDRAEAGLTAGTVDIVQLEALVVDHPLHERLTGQLMRALGASGRTADALHAYERLRVRLADELGVDPSSELQQIHLALLRGELAPQAPAPTRRTNLKAQLTSFVGRDAEVARIGKSLERHRLVTLVGPGGAGKTRLASEAAARIVDTAPDGVWLIELAPVTSGADIAQAALSSIGLREVTLMERANQLSPRDAITRLREGLAEKRAVLVLDNCEHLIEASAHLAEQLLGECPELRVLATSREPLGIAGETLLAVPPLGQPSAATSAREALEYPAVRLFADRAASVRPDFTIDDSSVRTVIEVVRRLDGLPLAIELAAARLRTMPLDEIAARIDDRFRLLTGGSRTALPRHRTLRAVVEWSWDLLTDDERLVAEELAVFPSGVTVSSATAVRPDGVAADAVPDLLASLIDKSLLQPAADGYRVRMLETIREYGAERLGERGELGPARERHAVHFAALLGEAVPHLTTSGQLPWFELLQVERENILAALRFRCDVGDADEARRIAVSLSWYAMMKGEHNDISGWMYDALVVPGGTDDQLHLLTRALFAMNSVASAAVHDRDAIAGSTDLAVIAQELIDIDRHTHPIMSLVRPAVAFFSDNRELMTRFAADAMQNGDEWSRAAVHMFLANNAENEGDVETMRAETAVALVQFRQLGERWGIASTLRSVAALHTLDGELEQARAAYEESLALMTEMNSTDDQFYVFAQLADLALRNGDLDLARAYIARAGERADLSGSGVESMFVLSLMGEIERRVGNVERGRAMNDEAMRRLANVHEGHPLVNHLRSLMLGSAGRSALEDDDVELALELMRQAYPAAIATADLPILARVGVVIAAVVAAGGDPIGAAEMLGACAALRGAEDRTATEIVELTAELHAALPGEEFNAAYDRGRAFTRAEAIARLDPSEGEPHARLR